MRIIKLVAENVKRLKLVDITPEKYLQAVTGRNASGKSSVLDAIMYALAGKASIPGKPVRSGCQEAVIRLNLGDIVVERNMSASGKTSVSVTNADGSTWKSPQAMLDSLLGELTFDPLKFAREKPREQFDELRKISKLSIDIDKINLLNEADFQKRTAINRSAKEKRASAAAVIIPDGLPAEPVSESDILDGIEEAGKFNADIDRRRSNRERAAQDIADLRREAAKIFSEIEPSVDSINNRIEEMRRQIQALEIERNQVAEKLTRQSEERLAGANELESKLLSAGPLPDQIVISDLRASLDQARYTNKLIEKRVEKEMIAKEAAALEAESVKLTESMAARERQVEEAIKAASMPISGLGFGADHVTYNGVPFDQASSAEQLRVSVSIAMAANPKLRVIRIQDGSLLDEDSLKMISDIAEEKDYQVWCEIVDTSGKVGVYMEEGEVKAVDGNPVPAAVTA